MKKIKIKNKKTYIILGIILFFVTISLSFGRYVYYGVKDMYLRSKKFYFNSDKLTQTRRIYKMDNYSGVDTYNFTINLNNSKNNLEHANSDIDYEVTYACSDNANCSVSKTNGTIYDDPKNIKDGKLKIPPNVWYIGTINNDDSTFMVTDKVYDRAMPLDINDKGQVFEPLDVPAQDINYSYLDNLFKDAMEKNQVSEDTLNKINEMDDYVIKHFRIAFGNRIVAHMKKFVPVYVGCGGDEVDGVDYFIARKILRKFEQLNISYIRDEIDGFIEFLDKTFGKGKMKECEEYLLRLKKLT